MRERTMPERKLYIDGSFVDPASGEWFGSTDPYADEEWIQIPEGGPSDVDDAVRAAHRATFEGEWSDLTPTERGRYLYDLADCLEGYADRLAEEEVRDNGKPIREMRGQHRKLPEWYRFYGGLADKVHGDTIEPSSGDKHIYTLKEPMGVIAAIAPWNSPLMLATWKIAPALAAGNAVVLKPSKNTSTSALTMAEAFDEVGFPDGVFNVVTGPGSQVGQPLVEHDLVAEVSLTGGTETGKYVARSAGENLVPSTMELGGKSPNVVFPDARIDNAVEGALSGIFSAAGQSCAAGSRLFLHEDIHDEFVDRLVDRTNSIRLGDPKDPSTEMGPIAKREQFETVAEYVEIGKSEGAELVCGGGPPEEDLGSDLFFRPTIFTNVDNDSRLAQEEVFGPVLSVIEFSTEVEAIEKGNDVRFGLSAGVWTEDMRRAHRVASALRAGRVWVNNYRNSDFTSPQGGYKESGWGSENGVDAIEEFQKTKAVWVELSETTDPKFGAD